MRFKIKIDDQTVHKEIVTTVSWTYGNEVYSASDDNTIWKKDMKTNQTTKFMDLTKFPTDMDWQPGTRGVNDTVAIGYADGSFELVTKLGKVDKSVADAHKGAVTSLKWSNDGSALATAGEDGQLKVWSKTGNLRTPLVQTDKPIYCVCWSPESDSVLYCTEKNICIKPHLGGSKQVQWKAHDGLVLKLDWNTSNNLIISAGEDCRYKIWDSYGRLLFSSNPYDYVITSLAWSPNGEYFAVGAFEMLRLCDKTGWSYSFDKIDTGSLMKIVWSPDGTICAGAGGNGRVVYGYVVDRNISWSNWEIALAEDNKLHVSDLINEMNEDIEIGERIITITMGYDNLILTTPTRCYIYNVNNWSTPHIFDIKDSVNLIVQSPKYFCLVDVANGILIYNYEGKQISSIKATNVKYDFLNRKKLSISQDILAIIDTNNSKFVKFFEVQTGKPTNFVLEHNLDITDINLNKSEIASERKIAFIDSNKDLFLSPTYKRDIIKLAAMTDSFLWNDKNDTLAAVADGRLVSWYYPNAIYVDKDLMDLSKVVKEIPEIGQMTQMISFYGSQIVIRRKDGGLVNVSISPYPSILFEFCEKQKWNKAVRLCRFVQEQTLWACLAALSLNSKELNTAEIALAAIEAIDKVQTINKIKELPSEASKNAHLALYFHKPNEAEQILLQAKLYYRAIKLNIKLFKWDRALEIATNQKTHLETVLAYRKRYLERIGKEETNKNFVKLFKEHPNVDMETVKANIKIEKEKEKSRK